MLTNKLSFYIFPDWKIAGLWDAACYDDIKVQNMGSSFGLVRPHQHGISI